MRINRMAKSLPHARPGETTVRMIPDLTHQPVRYRRPERRSPSATISSEAWMLGRIPDFTIDGKGG
jgi:hypothetical protein